MADSLLMIVDDGWVKVHGGDLGLRPALSLTCWYRMIEYAANDCNRVSKLQTNVDTIALSFRFLIQRNHRHVHRHHITRSTFYRVKVVKIILKQSSLDFI